jgi:hypothetical protein
MSPEQLSVESLAVAFVVESSLAVAQAWRQVLLEYVQLLLKRLADTHPNVKVSLPYIPFDCHLHTPQSFALPSFPMVLRIPFHRRLFARDSSQTILS